MWGRQARSSPCDPHAHRPADAAARGHLPGSSSVPGPTQGLQRPRAPATSSRRSPRRPEGLPGLLLPEGVSPAPATRRAVGRPPGAPQKDRKDGPQQVHEPRVHCGPLTAARQGGGLEFVAHVCGTQGAPSARGEARTRPARRGLQGRCGDGDTGLCPAWGVVVGPSGFVRAHGAAHQARPVRGALWGPEGAAHTWRWPRRPPQGVPKARSEVCGQQEGL